MFTVPPQVVHSIYMPKDAVIHTVKHGKAYGEQRFVDARTREFDTIIRQVSEEELQRLCTNASSQPGVLINSSSYGPYKGLSTELCK